MALTWRERFLSKFHKRPSGCWEWTAARMINGYGVYTWYGADRPCSSHLIHRIAYTLFVGPIPAGYVIDHLCRNAACGNPQHLEAVTQQTNLLRGTGWPAINARKRRCARGHRYTPKTVVVVGGKRRCRICHARNQQAYKKRRAAA